jgi:hypothetical protein
LVLIWLAFTGVSLFSFAVAQFFGLFAMMYGLDNSRITVLISILYFATAIHCAVRVFYVSDQLAKAAQAVRLIESSHERFLLAGDGVALGGGAHLPGGVLVRYVHGLLIAGRRKRAKIDQSILLQTYDDSLKGPQEIGWFMSDLLIQLGLLGTIVGFILMVGPLSNLDDFDVSRMRELLAAMAGNLGIALYTTLAGLIGGILLKVQYYFLDNATSELVNLTAETAELYILPALAEPDRE